MQVETFECQETASEPIEACEEAMGLIAQLELDGQKSLVSGGDGKPASRCPYREMKADERFVYGVLCPESTPLKRYALSPIPLRVLQIAAHANSLELFEELRVWHAKGAAIPDPVLVGVAPGVQYTWERRTFILARWGDVLESWPTLLKQAAEQKRRQIADVFHTLAARLQHAELAEQMTVDELIEKGADYLPELKL